MLTLLVIIISIVAIIAIAGVVAFFFFRPRSGEGGFKVITDIDNEDSKNFDDKTTMEPMEPEHCKEIKNFIDNLENTFTNLTDVNVDIGSGNNGFEDLGRKIFLNDLNSKQNFSCCFVFIFEKNDQEKAAFFFSIGKDDGSGSRKFHFSGIEVQNEVIIAQPKITTKSLNTRFIADSDFELPNMKRKLLFKTIKAQMEQVPFLKDNLDACFEACLDQICVTALDSKYTT